MELEEVMVDADWNRVVVIVDTTQLVIVTVLVIAVD